MATINNISQIGKYSGKTDLSKAKSDKLANVSAEVSTATSKSLEDSFSLKSIASFGAYSKDVATSTPVASTLVEETVVEKEEVTTETKKGMDISTLVGNDYTTSSGTIDINQMKTDLLVNFQNMIQQMLNGQADGSEVPSRVQMAAQASLEGDGYWSPESVSTRILDMAKALSGGDPENFEILKDAIIKGFGAAADAWGSGLPDITNSTYDLVMKGLDSWYNELYPTSSEV